MDKKEENDNLAQYALCEGKQLNIPQTCRVSVETDSINGRKTYIFDPHLNLELRWASKPEGMGYIKTQREMVNQW
jgi:adenine-specific DNA-methyltransferase